jgi:hypothetical protein
MSATQDPEKTLTKAAIEDAARDLKGIELTLCDHAGVKADGSSTIIRGDGTVVETWKVFYPLTARGEGLLPEAACRPCPAEEVRKIVRLFADDEVLALPKTRPDLVRREGDAVYGSALRCRGRLV